MSDPEIQSSLCYTLSPEVLRGEGLDIAIWADVSQSDIFSSETSGLRCEQAIMLQ